MAVYTVHAPVGGPDPRAIFVREEFSWPAFFLGPFWLAWRGLWRGLAAWLVAAALAGLCIALARPSAGAIVLVIALGQAFLGFEAQGLTREKLARRGYGLVDVVVGANVEDVETRFYRRRSQGQGAAMAEGDAA